MRKQWLRFGLASVVAVGGALGLGLAACGDDDSGSSGNKDGGGTDTGTNPNDSGGGDSGGDAADAAKPTLAKLTLVNAATDLGAGATFPNKQQGIRVCFAQNTAEPLGIAPYPPLPHESAVQGVPPAVFNGTGGAFPSFGLDLSTRILQPYVMNAASLAAKGYLKPTDGGTEKACDEILKADNIKENVDYWVLDKIPAGTFNIEKSYVIALTGCVGDATPLNAETCGEGFTPGGGPGKGNLKATVLEVTRTAVSASAVGVQFAHLSPAYQARFTALGFPLIPGFTADVNDAGAYRPLTDGGAKVLALTPAAAVPGVADTDNFASAPGSPPAMTPPAFAPIPLPLIQTLSGLGTTTPTVYKAGKNFVFIALGDPDPTAPTFVAGDGSGADAGEPGSSFNFRKYHYLAFPTDPEIQPYKP